MVKVVIKVVMKVVVVVVVLVVMVLVSVVVIMVGMRRTTANTITQSQLPILQIPPPSI